MSDNPRFFDRALRRLTHAWRDMAATVSGEPEDTLDAQMAACLTGRGGEVSARNRTARLARTYLALNEAEKPAFLRLLAGYEADPKAVAAAATAAAKADTPAERADANTALRRVLESPRLRLLTQFTSIPEGPKFLVDLRGALLKQKAADPMLMALDADLRGLLGAWFDIGFLELRRIDWHAPAALLEKLIAYEAVHAIRSWSDLKNRLDSDRRCYAFFHPRMPGEPLIFVEVALVQGLSGSVQKLLDEDAPVLDPRLADTAIFYSISNCQPGLSGISFGNFLIKRVVEELSTEFRDLKTFATLSPVPGFRRWLDPKIKANEPDLLGHEEIIALTAAEPADNGAAALAAILARAEWWTDEMARKVADPILSRLCARYLLTEANGKRARDPVAHFHLSNGARVERLNPAGDISEKGVRESAAIMVNYLYDLGKIEHWHEDYAGEGKRNASTTVRKLARGWS